MSERPRPANDLPTFMAGLEQTLRAMINAHRAMLAGFDQQREAIRHSRIGEMVRLGDMQSAAAARLAALEKRRVQVMHDVTRLLRPTATSVMTARELAAIVGGASGANLLALADELRGLVMATQRSSSILRAAADMLGRHVAGILQTVQSALSRARLYSRAGQVTPGAPLQFTVDLKS